MDEKESGSKSCYVESSPESLRMAKDCSGYRWLSRPSMPVTPPWDLSSDLTQHIVVLRKW